MPVRRFPAVAHLFANRDTVSSLSSEGFPRTLPGCQ